MTIAGRPIQQHAAPRMHDLTCCTSLLVADQAGPANRHHPGELALWMYPVVLFNVGMKRHCTVGSDALHGKRV